MHALALALAFGSTVFLLAACTRTPAGFSPDEARLTARWIEDLASGEIRRPGELRLRPASREMQAVADWLAHDDGDGTWAPPRFLHERQMRRAALDSRLADGVVLLDGARALVGLAPTVSAEQRLVLQPLVDAENRDRELVDALVIARSRAVGEARDAYLATVRAERLRRDLAAGGRLGIPQRLEDPDG